MASAPPLEGMKAATNAAATDDPCQVGPHQYEQFQHSAALDKADFCHPAVKQEWRCPLQPWRPNFDLTIISKNPEWHHARVHRDRPWPCRPEEVSDHWRFDPSDFLKCFFFLSVMCPRLWSIGR